MHIKYFFPIIFSSIILFSCSQKDKLEIERSASVFDIKQGEASVKQSNLVFTRSFKAKDSVDVANCFTNDAQIMIADLPPIEGRANIQSFISLMMAKGVADFRIKSTHIWGDSTILVEEGGYQFFDTNGDQIDKGKYIVLWKQEAGNWKMYRDMWNSNLPANTIQIEEKKPKQKKSSH
ncbi:MAG: hypothetical protein ABI208_08510 [Ginsengibacter sp.]|jgi:ketosteroid isomerase-like protein